MRRAYWQFGRSVHFLITDSQLVVLAAGVSVAAWSPSRVVVLAASVGVASTFVARMVISNTEATTPVPWRARRGDMSIEPAAVRPATRWPVLAVAVLLAVLLSAWRADGAWRELVPRQLGPYDGWVTLVDDPQPMQNATRVLVDVAGQRYEYWARGRAARLRTQRWAAGDRLDVSLDRTALGGQRQRRVAWQHVVGVVDIDVISDWSPASGFGAASNRLRGLIERGSAVLGADRAALFRGLVIGDDRDEPPEMIDRFRRSGLSHLTAVSGQNVVFVLAAASPLLRRLAPWVRWAVTLGLIAWFVALTRFEPSILRAGTMAAMSATAFVVGRRASPVRLLSLAVIALVLIDPLIVQSVGFVLSVGATAGVAVAGPWLTIRLSWARWLAAPLGVTIGAQLGVALPALAVFGRVPLVSLVANLVAVPVAGFTMLYGLPSGVVAGAVPAVAPLVLAPCRVAVTWVDAVARVAAVVEPPAAVSWVGWLGVVSVVAVSALVRASRCPNMTPEMQPTRCQGVQPPSADDGGRRGATERRASG